MLRLPHFVDSRPIDGGKVVSLTRRPPFTPGIFLVFIFVRGLVDSRSIVRLEGLGKLKKCNDIGIGTLDLQVCSIVRSALYAHYYCTLIVILNP
jgi:hypothetical protein